MGNNVIFVYDFQRRLNGLLLLCFLSRCGFYCSATKAQNGLGSFCFCCNSATLGQLLKANGFSVFLPLDFHSVTYTYETKSIFVSYLSSLTGFQRLWLCMERGLIPQPSPTPATLNIRQPDETSYPSCSLSGMLNLQLPLNLHRQQHREILLI